MRWLIFGVLSLLVLSVVKSDSNSDSVESAPSILDDVMTKIFGTKYDDLINQSAARAGIPAGVLFNLLYQESRFRDDIITGKTRSRTGALGIAQFMPATAVEQLGSVAAALDPSKAIPAAADYLARLKNSLGGDLTRAVAAYNWGIGNVQRKGLANAPTETKNYVQSILGVSIQ